MKVKRGTTGPGSRNLCVFVTYFIVRVLGTKKKLAAVTLLVLSTLLMYLFTGFGITTTNIGPSGKERSDVVTTSPVDSTNYLESKGRREMVIDLPTCKIPVEIEPVAVAREASKQGKHFEMVNVREECMKRPQFTLIKNGNVLVFNPEFENINKVTCRYRGIQRVPGSDTETTLTDFHGLSNGSGTVIEDYDAILVTCAYRGQYSTDYHALVQNKPKSSISKAKKSETPNILMIGLDSVSRYHFEKLMPKTRSCLKGIGAIEMHGYTKVGVNTFPNAIPFLTGFTEDEVIQFCYDRKKPIDRCPFIWHNLTADMSTAYIEDAPGLAIFNYNKFGFQNQPADYYLRPLMLRAAEQHKFTFPCVGSRSTEAFVLDYIERLHSLKSPLFLFTWLTSLAHDGFDNLPEANRLFLQYFQKLDLQNTILIFMSDHGLRFGDSRRTFNGWFNTKLPFFTITLPERVNSFLGHQRIQHLRENSKKLTTPFDLYHTLRDILSVYNVTPKDDTGGVYVSGTFYRRNYGQSMFTPIPDNRTCSQAGIPKQFCACSNPVPVNVTSALVQKAAQNAVDIINGWLPGKCKHLQVEKITAGAAMSYKELIVGFTTSPGGFHFEAIARSSDGQISERGDENGIRREKIERLNPINYRHHCCVNDGFLQLYCYCTILGSIPQFFCL